MVAPERSPSGRSRCVPATGRHVPPAGACGTRQSAGSGAERDQHEDLRPGPPPAIGKDRRLLRRHDLERPVLHRRQRAPGLEQTAIARQDRVGVRGCDATLRVGASGASRSQGRPVVKPAPGPPVHGIGVRACERSHHVKSGPTRAAGGSTLSSSGTVTSPSADLLAVVQERRPAHRQRAGSPRPSRSRSRGSVGPTERRAARHGAAGRGSTARPSATGPDRRPARDDGSRRGTRRPTRDGSGAPSRRRGGGRRSALPPLRWCPTNSSPTLIRPGRSSTMARNRPIRSGRSGWSMS